MADRAATIAIAPPAAGRLAVSWPLALLTAMLAACGSGRPTERTEKPAAASPPARIVEVEVLGDRLEPSRLVLRAGEPISLRVINRGRDRCLFFVADYLANLRAAPGGQVEMGFTVPDRPGAAEQRTAPMGCQGDNARMGSVVVQPRPA